MNALRKKSWSAYVVGAGIGVLSWFAFATVDDGLGITSPFEQGAAFVVRAAAPASAAVDSYFADNAPKIGWEWMLVLGVLIGSYLSSKLGRDREHPPVPSLWRERFGASPAKRFAFAFVGGAVMMVGARLAQGCTSGHGITGVLTLAVSSFLFIVLAFGAAVVTALTLYRGSGGAHHVR